MPRLANLEPVFFWDGPVPLVKLPTILRRRSASASRNSAFMRSSAALRASRRFQCECYPRLPLAAEAIKTALQSEGIQTIITQAEADGAVAQLAEDTAGIALSKDSDYFILCARGAGKATYSPLDTLEYLVDVIAAVSSDEAKAWEEQASGNGDDGFEAVTNCRRRRKGTRSCAFTPSQSTLTTLDGPPPRSKLGSQYTLKAVRLRAYSSHAIAAQLRLPPPLLPLLGSVVGNDYSAARQEDLLFRHIQGWTERIREAADVVHTEWQRSMGLLRERNRPTIKQLQAPKKTLLRAVLTSVIDDDVPSDYSAASSATDSPVAARSAPSLSELDTATVMDPVRALVVSTVNSLLARGDQAMHRALYVDDSEKETCVQSIIDSIVAYSLFTNDVKVLSPPNPAQDFFAGQHETEDRRTVLQSYRSAFDALAFPPELVSVMTQRIFLLAFAPEDPDLKTIHVGATREIRRWLYAVLFDTYGMTWARETMEEPVAEKSVSKISPALLETPRPKYRPGQYPDDIISVDTQSTDSAEAGADDGEVGIRSWPPSVLDVLDEAPSVVKPPPAVTEYLRQGDRVVGELVRILPLQDLLKSDSSSLSISLAELLSKYRAAGFHDGVRAASGEDGQFQVDLVPPLAPLLPLQTRVDLYRHALSSGDDSMDAVPFYLLPLAAAVRHLISATARKTGKSQKQLNWTRAEVVSAVRAGCQTQHVQGGGRDVASSAQESLVPREEWVSFPTVRGIHLASTLQLTLLAAHDLACSLLLYPSTLPPPHTLFDGPLLQLLLENDGNATPAMQMCKDVKDEAGALIKAVLCGYENNLALSPAELKRLRKESKRRNKDARQAIPFPSSTKAPTSGASGNLFAMLQDDTNDACKRFS